MSGDGTRGVCNPYDTCSPWPARELPRRRLRGRLLTAGALAAGALGVGVLGAGPAAAEPATGEPDTGATAESHPGVGRSGADDTAAHWREVLGLIPEVADEELTAEEVAEVYNVPVADVDAAVQRWRELLALLPAVAAGAATPEELAALYEFPLSQVQAALDRATPPEPAPTAETAPVAPEPNTTTSDPRGGVYPDADPGWGAAEPAPDATAATGSARERTAPTTPPRPTPIPAVPGGAGNTGGGIRWPAPEAKYDYTRETRERIAQDFLDRSQGPEQISLTDFMREVRRTYPKLDRYTVLSWVTHVAAERGRPFDPDQGVNPYSERLSDEVRQAIYQDRRDGMKFTAIAEKYGIPVMTARDTWERLDQGGNFDQSVYSPEEKKRVVDLVFGGMSMNEVSRVTPVSLTTIALWVDEEVREGREPPALTPRGPNRKYTWQDRENFLSTWVELGSAAQASRVTGIPAGTGGYWMRDLVRFGGISLPEGYRTVHLLRDLKDEVTRRLSEGEKPRGIASALNISTATVTQIQAALTAAPADSPAPDPTATPASLPPAPDPADEQADEGSDQPAGQVFRPTLEPHPDLEAGREPTGNELPAPDRPTVTPAPGDHQPRWDPPTLDGFDLSTVIFLPHTGLLYPPEDLSLPELWFPRDRETDRLPDIPTWPTAPTEPATSSATMTAPPAPTSWTSPTSPAPTTRATPKRPTPTPAPDSDLAPSSPTTTPPSTVVAPHHPRGHPGRPQPVTAQRPVPNPPQQQPHNPFRDAQTGAARQAAAPVTAGKPTAAAPVAAARTPTAAPAAPPRNPAQQAVQWVQDRVDDAQPALRAAGEVAEEVGSAAARGAAVAVGVLGAAAGAVWELWPKPTH